MREDWHETFVPEKRKQTDDHREYQKGESDSLDTDPTGAHGSNFVCSRRHAQTKQSGKQRGESNHPRNRERSVVKKIANHGPNRGSTVENNTDPIEKIDDDIQ
jgi:hypothetical protein